jgi:methyltransferase (TIGR00027 family)
LSTKEEWDIVSGVGLTALMVSVGRATESSRAGRLIDDPHAGPLVRAAMPEPPDITSTEEWRVGIDYIAVRSRYFDEWFAKACASGARQAVILASGLDTRAFRLDWPDGFRLFELDQPKVLEFKDEVLRHRGCPGPLRPTRSPDRPPRRLGDRATAGGFRPRAADRVAGRGPAALPPGVG